MRKIICILTLLFICLKSGAQVYFDEHWNKIDDKSKATYYELIDSSATEIIEKIYFINDSLYKISHFSGLKDKKKNGKCYQYYRNGKVEYDMNYLDNNLDGKFLGYYENGNTRRVDFYKNGKFLNGNCYTKSGLDTTYFIYEKSASYKGGGIASFQRFVMKQVKYPEIAAEKGIQGKVKVEFCVNSKGQVCDVKVIESPNYYLSKSALDAVLKSEFWEPAIQEGKRVKQKFVIPINFSLR